MPRLRHLLILVLAASLMLGCGLKGPLYLPDKTSEERKKEPAPKPATGAQTSAEPSAGETTGAP